MNGPVIAAATPAPAPPAALDLATFLRLELQRRRRVNRRYSLRAFAKALGIESSYLSKVLRGERQVTRQLLRRIEARLRLPPETIRQMSAGIADDESRRRGSARALRLKVLPEDTFRVIAEWYHYAILEASQLAGFKGNADWISRQLGLPLAVAQDAFDRLLRLGLLRGDDNAGWTVESHTTVGHPFSTIAFRQLQRGILEGAVDALERVPFEQREQSSITVATSMALLPEVRERVRRFRRELALFLSNTPTKDTVYHLGFSVYPVTGREANA